LIRALRLATVGDNCIDVYAPPISATAVGGNALNVAVNLARRGFRVDYLGAVGRDAAGVRVRNALADERVGSDRLRVVDGPTGTSRIRLAADGGWTLEHEDLGVCGPYHPSDDDVRFIETRDHVHCAQLRDFGPLLAQLAGTKTSVSYDFSNRYETRSVEGLAIAFFSLPASADEAGRILSRAVERGASLAVGTSGPRGSLAFDGEVLSHVPAPAINAVDTVGAGDAYIAGFIRARLEGGSVRECQAAGSDAGTKACKHLGAWRQALEPAPS
jgi:fructoselysine 6-kinase